MSEVPAGSVRTSFSTDLPQLQIAWDSTSLGAFKECPRKYQLNIVLGLVPRETSVHLTFGLHYHGILERYDHAKSRGQSHAQAVTTAVRYGLKVTWDKAKGRPWISDDPNKNRFTLIRSVVWYLEQFAEDPVETIILDNGKPAVELSFRMELGYTSFTGEPYLLSGHIDRLGVFNDQVWILDRKTSKSTLGSDFFEKYNPDNQFSIYTLATQVVYKKPAVGLIVDAVQVAVGFSRFARGLVHRTPAMLEEFHKDIGLWIKQAETYAEMGYWPMNDKSCNNYGGCPYRHVCSKDPRTRTQWMNSLAVRLWDPLSTRGDI